MFKTVILIIAISLSITACTQTVKGPITGNKYNVNIGGYSDKKKYEQDREKAMQPGTSDCNVKIIECPDAPSENKSYE